MYQDGIIFYSLHKAGMWVHDLKCD